MAPMVIGLALTCSQQCDYSRAPRPVCLTRGQPSDSTRSKLPRYPPVSFQIPILDPELGDGARSTPSASRSKTSNFSVAVIQRHIVRVEAQAVSTSPKDGVVTLLDAYEARDENVGQ